jgi:acyl carrier protein
LLITEFDLGSDALQSDMTLEDLGFDSLTLVELAVSIEKEFGILLDDDELTPQDTLDAVLRLLNDRKATVRPTSG